MNAEDKLSNIARADYYKTLKKEAKSQLKKEKKKWINKPAVSKTVTKAYRPTVVIRQYAPQPWKSSMYFQREYDKEKKNFFFK